MCKIEKEISYFCQRKTDSGIIYFRSECKECKKEIRQKYYQNNKNKIISHINEYRLNYSEIIKQRKSKYYRKNKKIIQIENSNNYYKNKDNISMQKKKYYQANKTKINLHKLNYQKNRERTDPVFKLRRRISNMVYISLRKNNSIKNNLSILKFLNYSIDELKIHLEQQFESWMNWNNWGIYDSQLWNDDDQSTWTWQIDHIIPHSTFKYTSMNDLEFKKCWNLDNLRPLSSKQNWLDGSNRVRHYKAD